MVEGCRGVAEDPHSLLGVGPACMGVGPAAAGATSAASRQECRELSWEDALPLWTTLLMQYEAGQQCLRHALRPASSGARCCRLLYTYLAAAGYGCRADAAPCSCSQACMGTKPAREGMANPYILTGMHRSKSCVHGFGHQAAASEWGLTGCISVGPHA